LGKEPTAFSNREPYHLKRNPARISLRKKKKGNEDETRATGPQKKMGKASSGKSPSRKVPPRGRSLSGPQKKKKRRLNSAKKLNECGGELGRRKEAS